MKYGQQRLAAGRKNFIFFLCPLDGEQFSFQDFLLDGAADRRLLFSFESSGQSGLKIEYFTTQKSYLKSKRTLS